LPAHEAREDTALITHALREAGHIARKFFGGTYKAWQKSVGNPVTEADIAIDAFLKETLLAARPDYGWLSEETADDKTRLERARTFIVDPIDGTHGFLKGRPQFTIVAAMVAQGRPVSGAVYNPITGEMFEAAAGEGARLNGAIVHVGGRSDFTEARLLATRRFIEGNRWTTPWPESVSVETRASIAYRMGLVAAGAFDAMISLSEKSDWDLAAGDLIVHEAGGTVTTDTGAALIYNCETPAQKNVICAGPALHRKLLAKLGELERPNPDY
jgi:myo-inositol-1(or 4)-monophosphatase